MPKIELKINGRTRDIRKGCAQQRVYPILMQNLTEKRVPRSYSSLLLPLTVMANNYRFSGRSLRNQENVGIGCIERAIPVPVRP